MSFGQLLRSWRTARRKSQLEIAGEAEVSSRHISFLETGRSQPSREMVLLLAGVLDLPMRESNAFLQAAGFAPVFRQSRLDAPELADVRRSIDFLLEHHDPYPAVLLDRHWNVLTQNRAALGLLPRFVAAPEALRPPINAVRMLFDERGARPFVVNWSEFAAATIQRLHREAAVAPDDDAARALLAECLAAKDVPAAWRVPQVGVEHLVMMPLHLRRADLELRLFTAITTLGTPLDVTLQELRLETYFPADAASETTLRGLANVS